MKSTEKPLLLNGKPFDPNPRSPLMAEAAKWFDQHPGEVFTCPHLVIESPFSRTCIQNFSNSPHYKDYVLRTGKTVIFGTPSAIQQFKKIAEGHES